MGIHRKSAAKVDRYGCLRSCVRIPAPSNDWIYTQAACRIDSALEHSIPSDNACEGTRPAGSLVRWSFLFWPWSDKDEVYNLAFYTCRPSRLKQGCGAGESREEAEELIQEAITMHLEALRPELPDDSDTDVEHDAADWKIGL